MLRSVVEARGPVAMILAALTRHWGDAHVPSVDSRRCPRPDRGGDTARGPLARVRLRHVVVRYAVLRSVAVVVLRGDRRLSTCAERSRPAAAALSAPRKRNTGQNHGTRSN